MTDDELERALFALPLEEPPVELRSRILAATVSRPRLTFRAWEVWLIGTMLAFMVWLAFLVGTSSPDIGGAISRALCAGVDEIAALFSVSALMWIVLGISCALWISQLSLPGTLRETPNREY
jgi:hypothetical protein